jgi:fumarate hydratase class II
MQTKLTPLGKVNPTRAEASAMIAVQVMSNDVAVPLRWGRHTRADG